MVAAQRTPEVPDGFWLELIAEWGSQGAHPGHTIELRVETFLSRLAWLKPACRRYEVGLVWGDELTARVLDSRRERSELDEALGDTTPLSAAEVQQRLTGSRFDLQRRSLRPFQLRDVGKLLALRHGANFSVPGTGKTTAAYSVYEAEHHAGRVEQLLVVAPLSAFGAWESDEVTCDKNFASNFIDCLVAEDLRSGQHSYRTKGFTSYVDPFTFNDHHSATVSSQVIKLTG